MTTTTVAKHYHKLHANERLALLLAAGARGDAVEQSRLLDAAPRTTWSVPHTFGRALAFFAVFSQHHMERLELAALFYKTSALAESIADSHKKSIRGAVRLYAYLILTHAKAWSQFCDAEQLDTELCQSLLTRGDVLSRAEAEAEELAFSCEEASAWLQPGKRDEEDSAPNAQPRLLTAEVVVSSLRSVFASLLQQWS